ncbi:MAG TPA: PAS domain S-box protein, partial [Myxococcales bacterium]
MERERPHTAGAAHRDDATERLRESEERFRAIFEGASDAVIVTDPEGDGTVLAANPAACRMFGYGEDGLRSLPRSRLFDPADPRLAGAVAARTATGHGVAELACVRRDGGRFTGEITSTIFADRAGRRLSITIIRDVTERRRADAEARRAAEVLELGDAFFELDAAFRVVRVNAQQERISRTPRERSLGRTFWEVWPETAAPGSPTRRELHRCMEERVPVSFEASFAALDVWTSAAAYPTSTGGIVVFVRDVSDRKRAEEALRESEALYRSLFALAPSGVVLNDERGRILAFNDQACTALGYAREEFARLHLADLDAHESSDDVRAHIEEIDALGGAEFEVQHRTRTGDLRDVLVRTRPVEIGGDRRFLNVWQDITERKRLVAELRESDRRKSEFLGVLSHELRNPLAPIRNGIHLLEVAEPGSEAARRAREVLRRQTEHLTRLVDDLLDVTRISRGKIVLHRERLELREIVRRTTDDLASLFERRGIALAVEHAPGPIWVDADGTRVAQVLGNLLQNAAKFTRPGGRVSVAVAIADRRAELVVRDDGVGIDPAHLERMFEPFTQAEHTLARTQGGLGLGLALVRGLVELHGGTVRARSAGLGRGAEFSVALPLAPATGEARPAPAPAREAAPGRVLVIEDHEDAASTLVELLEIQGHAVDVAHDGSTGVRLARERRPDVVVCDIGLPDIDGYAVARALRADLDLKATRLVALSG